MHKTAKMPCPHPIPWTCNKNEVLGQKSQKTVKRKMGRKG